MKFVAFILLTVFWEETRGNVYTDCSWLANQFSQQPPRDDLKNHKNWNLLPHGKCGYRQLPGVQTRISGAKRVTKRDWPWVLKLNKVNRQLGVFHCTGVLISWRYVLTAAHCCAGLENKVRNSTWFFGSDGQRNMERMVASEEIHVPEGYSECQSRHLSKHDICLVRLAENVTFTDGIRPICLPTEDILQTGDRVQIAGFGTETATSLGLAGFLQEKTVSVVSQDECRFTYKAVDAREICTSGGQCTGDSGGPLMKALPRGRGVRETFMLYGIISYGGENCAEDELGVSMRVTEYVDWILDYMKP